MGKENMEMTYKQAIEIIEKYEVFGCGYCHQGGKEIEEAFNMATQALQKLEQIENVFNKLKNEGYPASRLEDIWQIVDPIESINNMRDATPEENEAIDKYIKSISKPTGINIFDFYEDDEKSCNNCKHHLKFMCKNWETCHDYSDWELEELDFIQPKKSIPCTIKINTDDEDCISRKAVLSILADHFDNPFDMVRKLPSVIIPNTTIQKSEQNNKKQDKEQYEKIDCEKTDCKNCINHNDCDYEQLPSITISQEHDGCKDCKYEDYPEYYYPCCDCKQNYIDKWERAKHWIHRNDDYNDWLECPNCGYGSEGEVKYGEGTPFCPYCGERLEEK